MKKMKMLLYGISMGLVTMMLMSSGSKVLENTNKVAIDKGVDSTMQVDDILFDEECESCRYITIYDTHDRLVYDGMVRDTKKIKDKKLKKLLSKSDYLMSNRITDYFIITN